MEIPERFDPKGDIRFYFRNELAMAYFRQYASG